ncbi:hypothetical protein BC941DRAFT_468417 [Chlamydoabsidia padenii]|nr:hypothetical protein BC941DRAFT_468417 [Chlamydoabsidia padenii]
MTPDAKCSLAEKAYEGYSNMHALLLLHVINAQQLEPLSATVVEKMAKAAIYCGDYFPDRNSCLEDSVLPQTISFFHTILDRTTIPCISSVEEAIRASCISPSSIPVICPATTMMCAIYYLNKYLLKFGRFTHSYHVAQRLILVAYLVAAKFIHANIKYMVVFDPLLGNEASLLHDESRSVLNTTTLGNKQDSTGFETNTATQLLRHMGDTFMAEHEINADQLCSMEMEFLHFMDYQLWIGPSTPLQLCSWFYSTLDLYCQGYHTTVNSRS